MGFGENVRATKFFNERESQMTLKSLSPPSESTIPLVTQEREHISYAQCNILGTSCVTQYSIKMVSELVKNSGHRKFEHI